MCSWHNWGSRKGTLGSPLSHWDLAVGMCSSGLEEKKEAVQRGQKNSKKFPRGGNTIKENQPSVTFPSASYGLPWAWQPGKKDGEQLVGEGWCIVFSDTEAGGLSPTSSLT